MFEIVSGCLQYDIAHFFSGVVFRYSRAGCF